MDAKAQKYLEMLMNRLAAIPLELLWSVPQIAREFKEPPKWVAEAILRANPVAVDHIRGLAQRFSSAPSVPTQGAREGALAVNFAFLANPPSEILDVEKADPDLEGKRKAIVEFATPSMDEIQPDHAKLGPEETAELMKARAKGAQKALDEISQEMSMTREICTFLWLHWAHVEKLPSLRAVRESFEEATKNRCTIKLFEKVCAEIGLRKAGRGRPRKKPTS